MNSAARASSRVDRATPSARARRPTGIHACTGGFPFLVAAEVPADLTVVEVGLGGRFDATNVVLPAVSVITPVDYDHAEFLGTELAGIAREKAGVIKPGVPVVAASQRRAARRVIEEEAGRLHAPLVAFPRSPEPASEWDDEETADEPYEAAFRKENGRLIVDYDGVIDLPAPSLPGGHQFANAALAAVAARVWSRGAGGRVVDDDALARGIASAVWPARLQRLTAGPLAAAARRRGSDLWLDGGHNPHAARALADFARGLAARDGRPVVFVLGLLARKDVEGVMSALAGAATRVVATGFDAEAAADPQALAAAARHAGLAAEARPDVACALDAALAGDGPAPHVIIAGSLFLAGEVLALSPETWPT